MNNLYKDFIKALGIVSEEDFNDMLNELPLDKSDVYISDDMITENYYTDDAIEVLTHMFEYCFINKYDEYAYVTEIDFNNKTIEIEDIQNKNTLEFFNDYLKNKNWTLANYKACLQDFKEELKDILESDDKKEILDYIMNDDNISIEQLKKFINDYEN